ncbi:MAG: MFS transporter [Burkholderiales bacterium]|nr:MFS transporter [Burkholderiales bacterium]
MSGFGDRAPRPDRPPEGGVALALAATLAVQTLAAFAVYCAPVLAPLAAPAIGVEPSAVGYYVAATYAGSMVGSVAAGGWLARFGPIRVSQAGLALACAGLALGAGALVPLALVGGFVLGLGYGPATPASSAILVRAAPPSRVSLVFSIKQTGVPAGGVLAGAIVPALALAAGWQVAALAIGAACVALAVAIEPLRRRYDRDARPSAPVSVRSALAPVAMALGDRVLRRMCVCSFVYGGVQITLVTYLVSFLVESFGLSLVLAGLVMAVSQVASVAGRILWGVAADRLLARRTMLGLLGLGMGASAACALAAAPGWPVAALFAYAALFGATAVGWNGVFLAEVARVAPQGRTSEATGGCLFFTYLGVVLAPPAFNALLAAGGGYAFAYAAFAVPSAAVGAWLLAGRAHR